MKIKLINRDIEVKFDKIKENISGKTIISDGIIVIEKYLSPHLSRQTLLHELLHSFDVGPCYSFNETQVETLSAGLLSLMVNNRTLLDKIMKGKIPKCSFLKSCDKVITCQYKSYQKYRTPTLRYNEGLDLIEIKAKMSESLVKVVLMQYVFKSLLCLNSCSLLSNKETGQRIKDDILDTMINNSVMNFIYFYNNNIKIVDWVCRLKKEQERMRKINLED